MNAYNPHWISDAIINWNGIATEGGHDFSKERFFRQYDLLKEEILEYNAVAELKNEESAKEAADIFFVFTYLYFLYEVAQDPLPEIDDLIKTLATNTNKVITVANTYCDIEKVIQAVIESNYSKFPFIGQIEDPEQECRDIEERSNGRYEGVTYQKTSKFLIFKDKNGKILKPSTYAEPIIVVSKQED